MKYLRTLINRNFIWNFVSMSYKKLGFGLISLFECLCHFSVGLFLLLLAMNPLPAMMLRTAVLFASATQCWALWPVPLLLVVQQDVVQHQEEEHSVHLQLVAQMMLTSLVIIVIWLPMILMRILHILSRLWLNIEVI